MIEMRLHLDKIAKISMAAEEVVTMQSVTGEEPVTMLMMYRQLMMMSQRLEADGKDLSAVELDVKSDCDQGE